MTTKYLSPIFNEEQFHTDNGVVLAGGKIYTYAAGTTTLQDTFQDADGGATHSNPIVLDADGRLSAPIWLTGGTPYKLVLKTSADVTILTVDDVSGVGDLSSIDTSPSEWVLVDATPTQTGVTTYTLDGDWTTLLHAGRRQKFTDGTTKYGIIRLAAYDAGTLKTTVTMFMLNGASLTASLSAAYYGILAADNRSTPDGHITPPTALTASVVPATAGVTHFLHFSGLSANQTQALPTTGVVAGEVYEVFNGDTTYSVLLTSSDGTGYPYILAPGGWVQFKALQNTPTAPQHWKKIAGDQLVQTITAIPVVVAAASVTTATDNLAATAHGFSTGDPVQATTSGSLPGGLSLSTTYYAYAVDANNFKLSTTYANALAGTVIDITSQGSGNHTFTPGFMPPVGVFKAWTEVYGGGVGGSRGNTTSNSGGGGMSGAWGEGWMRYTPGTIVIATVGAGGAGASSNNSLGTVGGQTTFNGVTAPTGVLASSTGGGAGYGSIPVATGATFNRTANPETYPSTIQTNGGGTGGSTKRGHGGYGGGATAAGNAGERFGGGGGGGGQGATSGNGGAGGAGGVVLMY